MEFKTYQHSLIVRSGTHVREAKAYAIRVHEEANQMYGDLPYSEHLKSVAAYADLFSMYLETDFEVVDAISGAWVHDTIEDARQTYNDVKKATNRDVADIAYALTNEKGKTRAERANEKYYAGIRKSHIYVFVKLCDRLANVMHSKRTNSKMFEVYKKEQKAFAQKLFFNKPMRVLLPILPKSVIMWYLKMNKLYNILPVLIFLNKELDVKVNFC